MVLAALLFAIMGACIKLVASHLSTNEIVFFRGFVGAAFVPVLILARGGSLKTNIPFSHLRRGLAGMAAMWLAFYAISQLPLGTAATLTNTSPIWMGVILTILVLIRQKGRINGWLLVTLLVSFCGVSLVLRPTFHSGQGFAASTALISGFMTALAYMQVRSLAAAGEPDTRIVFYFSLFVTLIGLVATFITGWIMPTTHEWLLLLIISLTATLAQICMTRSYSRGKTLLSANLQYTGVVFSSLLGLLLWHDVLSPMSLLGMLLIVSSCIAATWLTARQ